MGKKNNCGNASSRLDGSDNKDEQMKRLTSKCEDLERQVDYILSLLDSMSEFFYTYDPEGRITFANKKSRDILGYPPEEIIGRNITDFVYPEDMDLLKKQLHTRVVDGVGGSYEIRLIHKDGTPLMVRLNSSPIWVKGKIVGGSVLGEDITEKKRMEEELRESEEIYRTIFGNTGTAMMIIEENTVISMGNTQLERMSGYSREEVENKKSWTEFIHKNYVDMMLESHYERRKESGAAPSSYESQMIDRSGGIRDVIINVAMIPGIKKSVVSIMDITERKQMENKLSAANEELGMTLEELKATEEELRCQISLLVEKEKQVRHISMHDPLTGLPNRAYFEEEMCLMGSGGFDPVGLIICDVDGLKLVNDTMGHSSGDRLLRTAGGVIEETVREGDIVARVGGDEFAVIMPNTPQPEVDGLCQKVYDAVAQYNRGNHNPPLSISVGFAVKNDSSREMGDVFREADNAMYRKKLHSSRSARSAIVQTLMKAIEARDYITEGHAVRLQDLTAAMAVSIGLPERSIGDLRLLAQFHDIGKVGIPDRILFKKGRLTAEEYEEMQRHSEIGHRIAQSAPEMLPIAQWILLHHEWWNGEGYPLGLQGENIPLECRILAIADAYDAMTSDRPYRKAMPHDLAIAELKRCAGTQFDPVLVEKFVDVLESLRKYKTVIQS